MATAVIAGSMLWTNVTIATTLAPNSTASDVCQRPAEFTPLKVLYTVSMSLILALSLIGNSVVIWAVIRSDVLRQRQTFPFAASLAASDIIMALSQIPSRILFFIHDSTFCSSLAACYVRQYSDYLGNIGSILNLFFISLDRFIAIQMPYKYFQLFPPHRCKAIIISIWSFSACWGICGMFPWKGSQSIIITKGCTTLNRIFIQSSFFGIFTPIFAVISCFYFQILRTALTQIRKMEKTTSNPEAKSGGRKRKGSQLVKELKTTKSIALVYVTFFMCWSPGAVIVFIKLFDPNYFHNVSKHIITIILFAVQDICPAISMSVNPIIYSFCNSQFRKAVRSLWRKSRIRAQSIDYLNQTNRPSCASATEMFNRDRTKSRSNSTNMIVGDSPRSINSVRLDQV